MFPRLFCKGRACFLYIDLIFGLEDFASTTLCSRFDHVIPKQVSVFLHEDEVNLSGFAEFAQRFVAIAPARMSGSQTKLGQQASRAKVGIPVRPEVVGCITILRVT